MLTGKRNIDQLFQSKLRDYEKAPPGFLWNNIERSLNTSKRTRRIAMMKGFGIAASILLAFLAGWWLTNSKGPIETNVNLLAKTVIQQPDTSGSIDIKQQITHPVLANASSEELSIQFLSRQKEVKNNKYKPSISSIASFASNTSFLNKNGEISHINTKELELFDTEKEFMSHFQNNLQVFKKLTDWFVSINNRFNNSDVIQRNKPDYRLNEQFNAINHPEIVPVSKNEPFKKTGKWSLSAEISPVYTVQTQIGGLSSSQKTSAENSISGGMMAGYKIGKHISIKSGIIFSQFKQLTKNVDFISVAPTSQYIFKTSQATTPSGKVNLNKASVLKIGMLMNSNNLPLSGLQSDLKQEFGYIEIPVLAVYKIIDRKFNVGVTGGISTNILTGNKAILYENGQSVNGGETANLRDVIYSGAVGLELGYDLGNRITFTVEPRIKHFLNSLSSNKTVDFKPNQLGIVTGVTYSFN